MEIDTKIADWQRRFGDVVVGQAKTAEELRNLPTDELHQRSLSFSGEIAAIRSEIEGTLVELPNGKAIKCGEYQALAELARLNRVEESRVLGGVEGVSGGRVTIINLSHLGLTDISPLAELVALQKLYLSSNQLTDTRSLAGLAVLQELSLDGNQLTDVSPLAGLNALRELFLGSNQLTDVSPLAGLAALQKLYLSCNPLTEIAPLSGLTALRELFLGSNQLTDISSLAGLTALQMLYLGNNQLADVSPLAGLTALRVLYLDDNQLAGPWSDLVKALKSRGVTTNV